MSDNNVYSAALGRTQVVGVNTAITATSVAVTTVAAAALGVERTISNGTTSVVYMMKTSSTGTTTGIILQSNDRITTNYVGALYFLGTTTGGTNVRIETISLTS